jgi:hypothetical protein
VAAAAQAVTPAEQLTRAVEAVTGTGFSYRAATSRGTIDGVVDIPNRAGKVRAVTSVEGTDITVDLVVLRTDYYLKLKGIAIAGAASGVFVRLRADRLESAEVYGLNVLDPSNTRNLPAQFVSVDEVSAGRFAGTLDLTKGSASGAIGSAAKGSAFGATSSVLALMGQAATTVPFEAGVDSGGRLATLTYTLPPYTLAPGFSAPAAEVAVSYADFGRPVKVARPTAAHVVEAPPGLYRQLAPAGPALSRAWR